MTCLTTLAGCLVRYKIVRTSLTPIEEDVKGILYVADERPIQVGVEKTDVVTRTVVQGYYLVHKNDLVALIKRLKAYREKHGPLKTPSP